MIRGDEVQREWAVGDEPSSLRRSKVMPWRIEDRVAQRARGDELLGAEPLELAHQRRRMFARLALSGEDLVERVGDVIRTFCATGGRRAQPSSSYAGA